MLNFRTVVSLVLALAAAASADIVCDTTPITKGTLAIGYENPTKTGPLLGVSANGTVETRGTTAGALIWTFPCTSQYLGIDDGQQTKIPQAKYGLLIVSDGPDTIPNPNSQCLAVQFDKGSQDAGALVVQPCSFEDDESQRSQFFSLWKTKKPAPYFQFERFQGYDHYQQGYNPYMYGQGYNANYANKTGSSVRMTFGSNADNLLTLVKPRH